METKKELKTYQWKGKNKLGKEISGEMMLKMMRC